MGRSTRRSLFPLRPLDVQWKKPSPRRGAVHPRTHLQGFPARAHLVHDVNTALRDISRGRKEAHITGWTLMLRDPIMKQVHQQSKVLSQERTALRELCGIFHGVSMLITWIATVFRCQQPWSKVRVGCVHSLVL